MNRSRTLADQWADLRRELRAQPLIDWHYLGSLAALHHALLAALVGGLCVGLSWLLTRP